MKIKNFVCASGVVLITGCSPFPHIEGDGDVITETVEISDYVELHALCHSAKITYTQSADAPGLSITTDRNIYEKYEFIVKDGHQLVIQPKKEFRRARFSPTEFTVVTRSRGLEAVELGGEARFHVDSPLTGKQLSIELAGSGTVTLPEKVEMEKVKLEMAGSGTISLAAVQCQTIQGEIAGSGTFNLRGTADKASYDIAGSGTIKAFDLQTNTTTCDLAGSGKLEIFAEKHLDLDMAGHGNIRYKGNPSIHKDGLSMGNIERAE